MKTLLSTADWQPHKIAILIPVLLLLFTCQSAATDWRGISAEETLRISASITAAASPRTALILDVRSLAEYENGHVPGAQQVAYSQIAEHLDELAAGRERGVIVYCEAGIRARKAADTLLENGFTNVRHLDGDMRVWRAKGLPITRGNRP